MYNKLFTQILDSSVWVQPDKTRIVWITCLAAMNSDGFVRMASPANLARRAHVSLRATLKAIAYLEAPDPDSSDTEFDGRRIERMPGGWRVKNFERFHLLRNSAADRANLKDRVQKHRAKRRLVTLGNQSKTQTQTQEEEVQKTVPLSATPGRPKAPPDPNVKLFLDYFQETYTDKRHGAKYLVSWERDSMVVKRLLKVATLDELKVYARMLLDDRNEDPFIIDSDRGIGVLSAKFNFLSDRYATWKAQHASTQR